MKRLLGILALLLVPVVASADTADQLLTAGGTLYSVSVVTAAERPDIATESSALLVLNVRNGGETTSEIVPATLGRGWHYNPSLAYENESGTIFLFWMHNEGLLYSNLFVAARDASGTWGEARAYGSPWNARRNLRMAVTRNVDDPTTGTTVPGISVHLTWWEFDSRDGRESARYAMVVIEHGAIVSIDELDLSPFVTTGIAPETPLTDAETALLKQPVLFPSRDQVQLLFGDLATGKLQQVTIRPTLPIAPDGRIRIPVGRSDGDAGSPRLTIASSSAVEGISDGQGGVALFTREGNTLRYVLRRDGAWGEERTITLDDAVQSGMAVEALRRLVREH